MQRRGRGDFSGAATHRAVASATLQHPLTLFPIAAGLLGALWMALIDASPAAFLVTLGGLGAGTAGWVGNFFFRWEHFANDYFLRLHRRLSEYRERAFGDVMEALARAESEPATRELARRGRDQFAAINAKYDALREILSRKMDAREITYVRFVGTAEQVYLNALDNLRDVVNYLESIRAIGVGHEARLARLRSLPQSGPAERREIETLEERAALGREQLARVKGILAGNEEAMTRIDALVAALVQTRMRAGAASVDIQTATRELQELAGRVHRYAAR